MSAISDFQITDTTGYKVADVAGSSLSGTVAENKATFDQLGELIIDNYNDMLDYLDDQGIDNGVGASISEVYPVGSIYMSVNSTNPTTLFGGTWVQIADTFLLAAGTTYTAGSTGGEATVTLTSDQCGLPAHSHSVSAVTTGGMSANATHKHTLTNTYTDDKVASGSALPRYRSDGATSTTNFTSCSTASVAHTHTVPAHTTEENTAVDATAAHNNMPPYLAVYVWYRTA